MLKFDIEKTVRYWLEGAEYDMDVAEALHEKAKYLYALFTPFRNIHEGKGND